MFVQIIDQESRTKMKFDTRIRKGDICIEAKRPFNGRVREGSVQNMQRALLSTCFVSLLHHTASFSPVPCLLNREQFLYRKFEPSCEAWLERKRSCGNHVAPVCGNAKNKISSLGTMPKILFPHQLMPMETTTLSLTTRIASDAQQLLC